MANAKGRIYTYDSRQAKKDEVPHRHLSLEEFNKGDRQLYIETPIETFATNVYRGSGKVCLQRKW